MWGSRRVGARAGSETLFDPVPGVLDEILDTINGIVLCSQMAGIRNHFDHFQSARSDGSGGKCPEVHFWKLSDHFTEVECH